MPQKVTEPLEAQIRQYLVDNIRPAEMHGYDPQQTDPTAADILPISNDWSDYGDTYPVIVVQENNGPTIPNSGNTNVNGIQGDGSGTNQTAVHPITISVQATQDGDYLNNVDYQTLVTDIYAECRFQLKDVDAVSNALYTGDMTPPTQTRSNEETDSGSTVTWLQRQGTVPVGFRYTP